MRTRLTIMTAILVLAGAGCKSATCEKAVDNLIKIENADLDEDERKAKRKEMIEGCKEEKPPKKLLACIAKADDEDDLDKCRDDARDAERERTGKKAKSSEPVMNLKKIYQGARAYYTEETVSRGTGTVLPPQFPESVSTTPAAGSCCDHPTGKCPPDPAIWSAPGWQALKFSMDDPHYYSYTFESSGTGASAVFTARATGDLDCDGTYSTFEMYGSVGADGEVVGSAGVYKENELE